MCSEMQAERRNNQPNHRPACQHAVSLTALAIAITAHPHIFTASSVQMPIRNVYLQMKFHQKGRWSPAGVLMRLEWGLKSQDRSPGPISPAVMN
jgi:hypothetical protein